MINNVPKISLATAARETEFSIEIEENFSYRIVKKQQAMFPEIGEIEVSMKGRLELGNSERWIQGKEYEN
jgi:hypothetical protein